MPDISGPEQVGANGPPVGRVVGTEDSTPLQFSVALDQDAYLQLDDVVVTVRAVPGREPVATAGVVTEVLRLSRGRHLRVRRAPDRGRRAARAGAGDRRGRDDPGRSRGLRAAVARRVRLPGHRRRAGEGPVLRPDGAQGRGRARPRRRPHLPEPEFLDGTRGGHYPISGISGVATKTSFALFLLYSIFTGGALKNALNAKAGAHLQRQGRRPAVPRPREPQAGQRGRCRPAGRLRDAWASRRPFASVGFFAPPTPDDLTGRPHVTGRTSGVSAFWWTLAEFCSGELLPYVFADAEDERNQYTMVIHQVAPGAAARRSPPAHDGAVTVEGRLLRTYDDLIEFLSDRLTDEDARRDWAARHRHGHGQRVPAPAALQPQAGAVDRPRRPGVVRPPVVTTEGQQLTVIDLHNLPERAQRFVVGVVLAQETARKEAAGPAGCCSRCWTS